MTPEQYAAWTADLPADLRADIEEAWGPAPGRLFVNDAGELVLATLRAGNVVLLIQPPRGFGENPVAIYHDPDLAPSHHYLAAYRWIAADEADGGFLVVGCRTTTGFSAADLDALLPAAGLRLEHRFATWDLQPWQDDAEFAVSVLRRDG